MLKSPVSNIAEKNITHNKPARIPARNFTPCRNGYPAPTAAKDIGAGPGEQVISFYESLSQEVIKNAVGTFQKDKVIVKQKLEMIIDGVKTQNVFTMGDEYNEKEKMEELLEKIGHFRKQTLIGEQKILGLGEKQETIPAKI